jgi:hypothetical protein
MKYLKTKHRAIQAATLRGVYGLKYSEVAEQLGRADDRSVPISVSRAAQLSNQGRRILRHPKMMDFMNYC